MNSGDTDPWSGDDVPVAPGLGDIVWDTPSAIDAAAGIDAETVTMVDDAPSRIRRLAIPTVAVAAVGVILLAILAWPEPSEPTADEPASSTQAASTILDALPPATTPPTTATPTSSEIIDVEPEVDVVFTGITPAELPAVLAEAELVTEVVTVTVDGELITLSLPDGAVTERVDLGLARVSGFDPNPTTLIVSPDAAMYANANALIVTPSGGPARPIDSDDFDIGGDGVNSTQLIPFGWVVGADGDSVFVVISFDNAGRQSEWLVTRTGEVSPAPAQRSGTFARPIFSLGTRFIGDAGGTYRVDANGNSNRMSNGEVLAISETRVLLRECNANRVCNAVLRNYQGEEVRVVDLPTAFRPWFFAASLAPDDEAVALADPSFSGERLVIELDTGETINFADQGGEIAPPKWSSDGAGLFALNPEGGIRFLDRSSGEEFVFAQQLGQIRAIATRSPTG